MKTEYHKSTEIAAALRRHTGSVFVGVLGKNDVVWVKAEKKGLIEMTETLGDYEMTLTIEPGRPAYLGNCFEEEIE